MEQSETISERAQEALSLAGSLLEECENAGFDEIVSQAALGNAWFQLCLALGFTPENFDDLLNDLSIEYKIQWEHKNSKHCSPTQD